MYNQLYLDSQRRTVELVEALSPDERNRPTPACPQWNVQDILAHLAGASAAFAGGGDRQSWGTPEWTAEQVAARRGRQVSELVAEWHEHAPQVAQTPLTDRIWLPILHDALSHEADIRGAIDAPLLPSDALAASWALLTAPLERRLARLGTVLLDLDEQRIVIGSGTADLEVEAVRYDFWRALFGRRSPGQLRAWVRTGDAESFVATLPLFPARDTDLREVD